MDFKLSPEQELLRDEARKLAHEVFQERAARWDRQCEVPWENIRLLAGKGYFGLLIPEQYGGAGGASMDLLIVLEEIAWACVSTALYVFSANAHANRIAQLGADAHRRSYLPRIASGEVIPCHAMSEPQAGSDAMQLFGANGYSCAYPLERLYRDVRGLAIAGGTTQIQRNLIARAVLGRRRY